MSHEIDQRLAAQSITLPTPAPPAANYVPFVIAGGLLTISGQLPMESGAIAVKGKLGGGVSLEDGQRAARLCAINILAQAQAALGDFVASTPDFVEQHKVVNGASDLIATILGEAGIHARAAVGVSALPLDAAVEVEALFAVE